MSNVTHSIYDLATGLLVGRTISCPPEALAANIPPGHSSIEGVHDHLSRRVDLATGEVVDYIPPAPSEDHVWDESIKRWAVRTEIQERIDRRTRALQKISQLEMKQPRILRELALYTDNAALLYAHQQLIEIENEIRELRKDL